MGGQGMQLAKANLGRAASSNRFSPVMKITKEKYNEMLDRKDLKQLFENNKEWQKSKTTEDKEFFVKSALGQQPKYLWIGCSDARVPANEMVGCGPGELFVHRNVANLVVSNDNSLMSVFQYAIEYLEVEHILICGHYDCSGVSASMVDMDLASPLEEWVQNIRDVYRLHRDELDAIANFEERKRRLVELNVQEQALNVYKTAVVQRRRMYTHVKTGFAVPKVHAVVFEPKTGILKRLNWVPYDNISKLSDTYELYDTENALLNWSETDAYPKRPNTVDNKALFNRLPPGLGKSDSYKRIEGTKMD
jgi:carbonic anhydrase